MSLPNGWTFGHLIDKMLNNMMENGYDSDKFTGFEIGNEYLDETLNRSNSSMDVF